MVQLFHEIFLIMHNYRFVTLLDTCLFALFCMYPIFRMHTKSSYTYFQAVSVLTKSFYNGLFYAKLDY